MEKVCLALMLLCVSVHCAPPATHGLGYYRSESPAPTNPYQPVNTLDYYLDDPNPNYYHQASQKQDSHNRDQESAKQESLNPDSEVELLPGVQPQQPPQQTPVSPNIPGLIPGQRVYIVHMPVPGYRPGTFAGYQPVYVVAAAPSGNACAANGDSSQKQYPAVKEIQALGISRTKIHKGYQNTVVLDPSANGMYSPYGYLRGFAPHPSVQIASPYLNSYTATYQRGLAPSPHPAQPLGHIVSLQGPLPIPPGPAVQEPANEAPSTNRVGEQSSESNETVDAQNKESRTTTAAQQHRSKL